MPLSNSELASELGGMVKGEVVDANHPDYNQQVKRVWNARLFNKKPLMFVIVESQKDISQTLSFCRKNKIPLCISNGGTSMFAQEDDAVVMILKKMNKVTINPQSKIVEVEGGATQGEVDQATVKYHFATTLGQASFVGVSGSGLLLGQGLLGRTCGYGIDNIHAVEMITASGEIFTANESQNEELFWAVKGYGVNFGITTKLWLKLHPMSDQVVGGKIFFAWDKAADTLKHMRDFLQEKNNNRLVFYGVISIERESDKPTIFLRYFFNGELEKGQKLLEEFCKRTAPSSVEAGPTSYDVLQRSVDGLHPFGHYYYDDKGGFAMKELTDEAIGTIVDQYNKVPSVEAMWGTVCYVIPVGGAYKTAPQHSSPFLFRGASYTVTTVASTPDANFQSQLTEWLEKTCQAFSPFAMKADEATNDQVWQRLRQVKRRYDPENIFKYNVNIDPS